LRLDRKAPALAGSDTGQVIVPGDAAGSPLIERVTSEDEAVVMPPDGEPLPADQIARLKTWIDAGAVWPDGSDGPRELPDHWAYRPIQRPEPPLPRRSGLVVNPIDAFVLARLEEKGIEPSPVADRYTLIKRLSYDLLGLPPQPAEVDAFVGDTSPDAYERLVEELLRSPHFGERWGRHWLDKARYADSDGYEKDRPRYNAWKYRDWVINAINTDMPFDRFTIEQLAGDLIEGATPEQRLATAFHRQTLTNTEGGADPEQWRVEAVFDRVETLGTVWLGLTVGCARCHSHKYDEISQREYYQLFAFFNNGDEMTMSVPSSDTAYEQYLDAKPAFDRQLAELEKPLHGAKEQLRPAFAEWELREGEAPAEPHFSREATARREPRPPISDSLSELPKDIRAILAVAADERSDEQRRELFDYFVSLDPRVKQLQAAVDEFKKSGPFDPHMSVSTLEERKADRRQSHVLKRGDFLQPLEPVAAQALEILPELTPREPGGTPDRLDLARWLVSADHPLTARVAVNHVWSHLFGRGLVKTANDFGVRGEAPTHPQLLDWLASEFMRLGWSRKQLIKTILLSHTYRQSSAHRPELSDIDPENALVYRQNRFRVEAEIVRDLHLAASGLLQRRIGGPSVFPPLPADIAALSYANNFKWGKSDWNDRPDKPHGIAPADDVYRRGMYTFFKRTAAHPTLVAFDCPDSVLTCVERGTSNTPLQALTTLNNKVFVDASRAIARRVLREINTNDAARLEHAFRLCVARPPTNAELNSLLDLLGDARAYYLQHPIEADALAGNALPPETSIADTAAWVATARIVMNLDEFITRE
jgi:hypothetical protein